MKQVYHSPALRGLRGSAHLITAATDAAVQRVSVRVGQEQIALSPMSERFSMRFWQGVVMPAAHADALEYTLYADLEEVGHYCIPLSKPNLAPLAFTELSLNMKTSPTAYLEVVNTTAMPIDLSCYQIMYRRIEEDGPLAASVLPIASAPGEAVLPPHETAVLWLAYASSHNPKAPCLTVADFCARLESDFSWRNFRLSPETVHIFRVEGAEEVEPGVWREKAGVAEFPKLRPWNRCEICLSPIGGEFADAVCRVTVNTLDPEHWDWHTPIRRASLWQPDPFGGADMRCIRTVADLTPGTLSRGQVVADLSVDRPACIAPIALPQNHPLAEGALALRWLAEGAGACTLVLDADTRIEGKLEDGIWSAAVPAEILRRLAELDAVIEADCGTYQTALHLPAVKLIDNEGPAVSAVQPENGYVAMPGQTVAFSAQYFDRAGVDAHASHLYLDGAEISSCAVWTSDAVSCSFDRLKPGRHKLALKLYDCLGNASRTVTYFTVAESDALFCYRGEVHSHTEDPDGIGTAEDAIVYARDVGHADYFAVTDHGHYVADARYAAQRRVADRYNAPGQYAVLRGWEMTWNNECGYWGHLNVLESEDICQDICGVNLHDLYGYLAARPGTIGMFNHPGYNWGNFNEYADRTPEADAVMCLDEIKGAYADVEYALALTKGWHLAPVSNEDNHGYNWTTATNQTGYVLAPGLTRQNVLEAMRARRTYTTSDPTLHLHFRINGAWLGSRIPATDMLAVDIQLDTERPEGLGVVSLVGEDNIVVAEWDLGALRHFAQRIHVPADFDYYYLKVINPLVPKDYTVCAPIWIEGRDALTITDLSLSLTGGEAPNLVGLAVENRGNTAISDLRADFYLTPEGGFSLASARPYCTVHLGKLGAGETARTARTFPHVPNRRRVSVVISGMAGRTRLADTRFLLLTPISLVEVLPKSRDLTLADGRTVKNPYTYAVLFSHANTPLSLDGMALRLWTDNGKTPRPQHIHPLDGLTLPARMPAVFWFRASGSPLGAADFCAHYGVDLIEGENLFILDGQPLSGGPDDSRRLDLSFGAEVLSRVHWNYADHWRKQPTPDRALQYGYRGGVTATAVLICDDAEPHPGRLDAAQMPLARIHQAASAELRRAKKVNRKTAKQARKPEPKKVKRSAAAALSIGTAAAGTVIGIGTALAGIKLNRKGRK